MIELDIQPGKSYIYKSNNPISVSRIGDVILLTKDLKEPQCRSPWELLFESSKLEIFGGSLSIYNKDILRIETELHEADLMPPLFRESLIYLSILQGGTDYRDYNLCLLRGKFCGYKINEKSVFDFNVDSSEIFYNR